MPKVVDRDLCSASADGTVRLWRMDNPVETELAENSASGSSRKKGKKSRKKHKNPLQIGSKDGVPMFRAAVVLRHPLQVGCSVGCHLVVSPGVLSWSLMARLA